jgi:hypothetical protein
MMELRRKLYSIMPIEPCILRRNREEITTCFINHNEYKREEVGLRIGLYRKLLELPVV